MRRTEESGGTCDADTGDYDAIDDANETDTGSADVAERSDGASGTIFPLVLAVTPRSLVSNFGAFTLK